MEDRYNVECCDLMHAHDEIVERVQKEMPGIYHLENIMRKIKQITSVIRLKRNINEA